jgi:pimeloyl-ACP methyl ester carboxylesterase
LKPVSFRDSFENNLGGFLHLPAGGAKSTGVVLVVSGVKDRVGPHRIQVRLARDLADRGYPVLRYDPCGIGESDGVFGNHRTRRHFSWIQMGLFGDSIRHAVSFMQSETGVREVVLAGLCGGATAAVLTEGLSGVTGYILLAPSSVFDSDEFETGLLKTIRKGRPIDRDSAAHFARHAYHIARKKVRLMSVKDSETRKVHEANVNFYFVERFGVVARRNKPALCVVIDEDPTCHEFETFAMGKSAPDNVTIHRVGGVGHEFGSVKTVEKLSEKIGSWLDAAFSGPPSRQ